MFTSVARTHQKTNKWICSYIQTMEVISVGLIRKSREVRWSVKIKSLGYFRLR